MESKYNGILLYCGINLVFFLFILIVFKPIYGSGDDVLCLYLLGGGYGFAPTELLLYNHILNPLITLPVKTLFILNPNVNWYTLTLIGFHFLATTVILKQICSISHFWEGLLAYTVVFMLLEAQFLLGISFTNTSIVLTWAGLIVLFKSVSTPSSTWNSVVCVSMFVLASLFRVHVIFPIVAVVLPFLFFRKDSSILAIGRIVLVSAVLIFFFNLFHQAYYKKHINGWEEREKYQQILYKYFNRGGLYDVKIPKWKTETEMIEYSLLLDSNYLNSAKLSKMYNELMMKRPLWNTGDESGSIKWLFINNRIYFLLFFVFLTYATSKSLKKILLVSVTSFIAGVVFLVLFLKLKDYIITGSIGVICLSLYFFGSAAEDSNKSKLKLIRFCTMLFLIFWASVRVIKVNLNNSRLNLQFKSAYEQIDSHRSTLFFVQDFTFPYDYIYSFDVPAKYSLRNVLTDWQYPEAQSIKVLHSFNINCVKDIPYADNVLFWGKPVDALLEYFTIVTGKKVYFSQPLNEFKYGEVRKIIIEK